MAFDFRWDERGIRDLLDGAESAVNQAKNQLNTVLSQAGTISAADLTRIEATQVQKDYLISFKAKIQAIYDEIINQGF